MKEQKSLILKLPLEIHQALKEIKAKEGVSINFMVEKAVIEYIKKRKEIKCTSSSA